MKPDVYEIGLPDGDAICLSCWQMEMMMAQFDREEAEEEKSNLDKR